jgi:iron complex outermembrane recepter protein
MKRTGHLRRRLGAGAAIPAAALAISMAGGAQALQDGAGEAQAGQPSEVITITGSRIRRVTFDTPQPITTVTGESIDQRGLTNMADAINELPVAGVPVSPVGEQEQATTGRNFINLFNLGSQRTLTLVNGNRFVGGNPAATSGNPGSQVDMNNIPTGLVDRVEIVEAGGAAVYGSDAIAGVVNILLKDDFEGFEADFQTGVAEPGDYDSHRVRFTAGGNFLDGRANLAANYEWSRTGTLLAADREFTSRGVATVSNPDAPPRLLTIFDHSFSEFNAGGVLFAAPAPLPQFRVQVPDPDNPGQSMPVQFAPDGSLVRFDPGTYYQPAFASGGDGFRVRDAQSVMSPVERHVFTAIGHIDLTPSVRLKGEFLFSNVEATEPANQGIFNTALLTGDSGPLMMTLANPFLTDQARSTLASAGVGAFFLNRAHLDLLPDNASVRAGGDTYRAVAGLEGDFEAAGRTLFWDVSGSIARTEGYISNYNIHQRRFELGIDAVRAPNGDIVCAATLANPNSADPDIAQCQPINLFGAGAPSAEARDYVSLEFRRDYEIEQRYITANIGGSVFDLPAGPVDFVAGLEFREEKSAFTPNEAAAQGLGRAIPVQAISGSYDTSEIYTEVLVPVLGDGFDLPFAQSLELQGAVRFVSNSLAGDETAWSLGGQWEVVDGLTFRGTRSRTFRAPSVLELFLPQAESMSAAGLDPCDIRNIGTGPNPATRQANCQAMFLERGLPADFELNSVAQNASIPIVTGGNPELVNEIADSWSVGFVLQPAFIPGLTVAVDTVDIAIKDGISNFNLQSILSTCYDAPDPDPEVCGRFVRDDQAQLVTATTGYINAGYINFAGESIRVDYSVPLEALPVFSGFDDPGSLNVSANGLRTRVQEISVSGLGFDLDDTAGEISSPEWTWRFDANYSRGPLRLLWSTQYIGSAVFDNTAGENDRDYPGVGSYFKHDATVHYRFTDSVAARVGVNNVFDETAPYPLGWNQARNYDVIGRFFFAGVNVSF